MPRKKTRMNPMALRQKKNKECVLRFKNGSPKLKDILRQKCKERWQQNREDFVDKLRNITQENDLKDTLSNIMKEDLKTVYRTQDSIFEEEPRNPKTLPETEQELNERLEWLMNQYNNLFADEERLADMLEDLNEVICPLCKKRPLQAKKNRNRFLVSCRCGLVVHSTSDLLQIKENIMVCLDSHNSGCNADPEMGVLEEDGEDHVYLVCYNCYNFLMLM